MARIHEELIQLANERILAKGDLTFVEEVFAPDYVLHAGGREFRGTGFVRKFIERLRAAIPDVRVVRIEFLVRARSTIAWQRTLRGTHKADLMGIPPTRKRVEWRDLVVTRFDGRRIAEDWAVSELAERLLLKQPRAPRP
jgi:predicted ester cyclase